MPALASSVEAPLSDRERDLVWSALPVGATPEELADLLFGARHRRSFRETQSRPEHDLAGLWHPWGAPARPMSDPVSEDHRSWAELRELVGPEVEAFRSAALAEHDGLSPTVKQAFVDQKGEVSDVREYYLRTRAAYVRRGYPRPAEQIFADIVGYSHSDGHVARILGRNIGTGVHLAVAEAILRLEASLSEVERVRLTEWFARKPVPTEKARKALGKRYAGEDVLPRGVGGFAPRRIAGTTKLSEHAFGLALDIDWQSNPHVRNRQVLNLIRRVSAGPGAEPSVDYGPRLLKRLPSDGPVEERRLRAYLLGDGAAEASFGYPEGLCAMSARASDKVRSWLVGALELEAEFLAAIDTVKRELKAATGALAAARARRPRVAEEVESARADKARAEAELAAVAYTMREDRDIRDLHSLRRVHEVKNEFILATWTMSGICSLPPELVLALKRVRVPWRGELLGFTWGQEWDGDKDTMHLEMNVRKVIPREPVPALAELERRAAE